ncbi:MAG: XdhC family protein [Syntrophomonadaceae bacterium]|nr:XdhC family protein [Syntrophomonadaceae bacterium]
MKPLWQDMEQLLSWGESFVVTTIFDKSGSVPRTAGAKMVIKMDGSIIGTIGGGRLEAEARSLAAEVFKSKSPLTQKFMLTGTDAAQMDMICGGKGEFLLDYIDAADQANLEIYRGIAKTLEKREKAWLITELGTALHNKGKRQQCLVKQDGSLTGTFEWDRGFLAKLIEGSAKISIHWEVLEDRRLLIEPIRNTGVLYIFGAGHVSQKIAPIAEMTGFKTVILDDRAEYASKERFPLSEIILLEALAEPLPDLAFNQDSYLVIVTRGHLHDKAVLGQVIRKPVAYIGMIGSRRKRDMVYKALKEELGLVDGDFARVHSPIGLDILAETPEEIAVSIVAELIKIRAERENAPR